MYAQAERGSAIRAPGPIGPADRPIGAERRLARRRAVGDWIPNAWASSPAMPRLPVVVRDISDDGIGFETKIPIEPGRVVSIGLDCPVWAEPVVCVIVNQAQNGTKKEHVRYRHGARFLEPDARKCRALAELI